MRRREFITNFLAARWSYLPPPLATTEPFPTRPIWLIVSFPAGDGADIVGRVLSHRLYEGLGQPVVIDNRSGAGGMLGTGARRQIFIRRLRAAAGVD
jgi:tripartite-type tricarboxylate transporter receptor subunit TctC